MHNEKRMIRDFVRGAGLGCLSLGIVACHAGERPSAFPANAVWIEKMAVDGRWRSFGTNDPPEVKSAFRVMSGTHRLDFAYGPVPQIGDASIRLRSQLEGVDPSWRESPGNGMRWTIRFQNQKGDVLGFKDFEACGDSPGWKGDVQRSLFTARRAEAEVPAGATKFYLMLVSGGPAVTLGVMVVDDVKVTHAIRKEVLFASDFEVGVRKGTPAGDPVGWYRGGMNRDLLRMIVFEGAKTNHALGVFDNSVKSFGEWATEIPIQDRVKSGEKLLLEWKELYSIGGGSHYTVGYGRVMPGRYLFKVQALDPLSGEVLGDDSLSFYIPTPFWKMPWFLVACAACAAFLIGWIVRFITRQRWKRRVERLEWQRAVERERTRIARDIHDDLGTNITRVGLLSQSIRQYAGPDSPVLEFAEEIGQTAREMMQTMAEIVWAVNPVYDTLDGLASFLGRFAQKFLGVTAIRYRQVIPTDLPDVMVSAEVRHNLFLAFKEALNNVAKHSAAQLVVLSIALDDRGLTLSIKDDGCGFEQAGPKHGNGLSNMVSRLAALGGACDVKSKPGEGTEVCITILRERLSSENFRVKEERHGKEG
jgi:signal transduction histidine kinase